MKKCEYCGRENDDAASTCARCATPFVEASREPTTAERLAEHHFAQKFVFALLVLPFSSGYFCATLLRLRERVHSMETGFRDLSVWYGVLCSLATAAGIVLLLSRPSAWRGLRWGRIGWAILLALAWFAGAALRAL